ncbi:transcription factor bHLH112 [Brachypodium distachyon]|uniref:BHLH domain-containing protein n=1 Tax=Brachypodium distachyon TaxID=15368 RepID=A0A0Q3F6U4_BRADI|nr:transcription factor bHLH112 [Brachypodium distachyon]KQJ95150.1 hypothetical protein BRADI_3g15440v3 [Brachypodium distachyon]|eukprot:XP_003571405.1 transcription factor bHLH112 [Brachypodium distachyon]
MADHHQEMIRAAAVPSASMYNNGGGGVQASRRGGSGGDWWSMAESPGSNSHAAGSSITFQEPIAPAADPATIAAGGWNQPSFMDDGSGFHGHMSSRPSDQAHINQPSLLMSPSSSNNNSSNMMLQLQVADQHDPNYQFLSNLGFELLSSPASTPYATGGGSRPSSLLRSLTEPSAAAKPINYQPVTSQLPAAASVATTPFWNPTTGFDAAAYRASLEAAGPPPAQSRPASLAAKNTLEGVGDSSSCVVTKKTSSGPTAKKARTGTPPSPLPTFKVRKEKLGDRVTALQQLVSPFGKTDTASVLHETIEYIKFLHDQVGAHSAPYLKNRQQQVPHSKSSSTDKKDNNGGEEAAARDLTGRGLCLVPISSTFAVASETPVVDYWNPFGAAFR